MPKIEELLDDIFGKKKPEQVKVALERLNPPPELKDGWVPLEYGHKTFDRPVVETSVIPEASGSVVESRVGSSPAQPELIGAPIDSKTTDLMTLKDALHEWADLLSTERSFLALIKKVSPGFEGVNNRLPKDAMNKEFSRRQKDVRRSLDFKKVIEDIKKGVKLQPVGSYKYEPYRG
jgi:hypothetical protein